MRLAESIAVLAFVAQVHAHGYVYRITADNTVYPGWDIYVDPSLKPAPKRIAFGGSEANPITTITGNTLVCNKGQKPIPNDIAEVRAGSDVTFHWSPWLHSHKGPITAWLAPYTGDISKVKLNDLEFFKYAEETMDKNGVWWNNRFIDKNNNTWTTTLPADIKPGTYILRHEIIALHFDTATTKGLEFAGVGPQFYPVCFNFKITGDGTATPKGVKFPGAYTAKDPAFKFNVNQTTIPFPPLGPSLYTSAKNVTLAPKEKVVLSPTGNGDAADKAYYTKQYQALAAQGATTSYYDSIGG